MMPIQAYIIISSFFTIYTIAHFYVYNSLKRGLTPSKATRIKIIVFLSLFGSLFPISRFFTAFNFLNYPASIWLGVLSFSSFILLIKDLFTYFLPSYKKLLSFSSIIIILALSLLSFFNEKNIRISEIEIKLDSNNQVLSGFSIIHLSDLHIDNMRRESWIQNLVEKVNSLDPDLILITGDIIDGRSVLNHKKSYELAKFKAKHGVYACLGNHEYYTGREKSLKFLENAGIKTLINSGKYIANGKIFLAGIDDEQGLDFGFTGPDIELALSTMDRNKESFSILLSHKPDAKYFKQASERKVDLILAGHTHAGQIPPFDLLVNIVYSYPQGLYKRDGSIMYTSSGTGSWGPPMRFLNHSEIVRFKLK